MRPLWSEFEIYCFSCLFLFSSRWVITKSIPYGGVLMTNGPKVSRTYLGQSEHANVVVSRPIVVAHTCNPDIHPAKAGGLLQVQGQPGLLTSDICSPSVTTIILLTLSPPSLSWHSSVKKHLPRLHLVPRFNPQTHSGGGGWDTI